MWFSHKVFVTVKTRVFRRLNCSARFVILFIPHKTDMKHEYCFLTSNMFAGRDLLFCLMIYVDKVSSTLKVQNNVTNE
jgi:hypothetical protein